MQRVMPCEKCGAPLKPTMQGAPPQVLNGPNVSVAVLINIHVECTVCGAKYYSQIVGVQFQMGFVQKQEENRIIVPEIIPPNLTRIK